MSAADKVFITAMVGMLFTYMLLLLSIALPARPPYWYRLARVCCRMYVRAWLSTPL